MALVDTLPLFEVKPLNLRKPPSKLVARKEEIIPTKVDTSTISVAPKIDTTKLVPMTPTHIPKIEKNYEPLYMALADSSIVNPHARAAILAQMKLETGNNAPAGFNFGNITTGPNWKGKSIVRGDKDAKGNPITQNFRAYNSPKEFIDDYVSVLKQTYPAAYAELFSDNFDINRFTEGLVGGKYKYATDPTYKSKVASVYNSTLKNIIGNK